MLCGNYHDQIVIIAEKIFKQDERLKKIIILIKNLIFKLEEIAYL